MHHKFSILCVSTMVLFTATSPWVRSQDPERTESASQGRQTELTLEKLRELRKQGRISSLEDLRELANTYSESATPSRGKPLAAVVRQDPLVQSVQNANPFSAWWYPGESLKDPSVQYVQNAILSNKADLRTAAMLAITRLRSQDVSEDYEDQLREALADYFVADMQYRTQELEKLKRRMEEMDAHLTKRMKARDAIIDLQVKLMMSEKEGLGLFSSRQGPNTFPELPAAGLPATPGYLAPLPGPAAVPGITGRLRPNRPAPSPAPNKAGGR